jgi:hypothetical protein
MFILSIIISQIITLTQSKRLSKILDFSGISTELSERNLTLCLYLRYDVNSKILQVV